MSRRSKRIGLNVLSEIIVESKFKNDECNNRQEESDMIENEDPMLPKKSLFNIYEVAEYFGVTERTIRLWIEHGHLESEKIVGSTRISRESILKCRFRKR